MILRLDLQLFSEEKTEQPTAKKLRDARNKGQVAQSKDFNSAVSLLAVFVAFSVFSKYIVENILAFFHLTFNKITDLDVFFTSGDVSNFFGEALLLILKVSLPLLLIALVTGVASSYAQVGFLFTLDPLKPKFSKINPLKGFKNMFSSRAMVELFKSVAKATLILYVSGTYVSSRMLDLTMTVNASSLGTIVAILWSIIYNVIIRCSIILFIIAVVDYEFKRRKNKKELMMTKQEVKQEYKQSEGDPQLKARIKEKQREMAMSRMMQEVPKADVIITNPTHFAVAIKYDSNLSDAPLVIAKGQDLIAQNIKRVASEHDIPMVENVDLARNMYSLLDIGDKILPEMYEAVAEILAFVYSVKN